MIRELFKDIVIEEKYSRFDKREVLKFKEMQIEELKERVTKLEKLQEEVSLLKKELKIGGL